MTTLRLAYRTFVGFENALRRQIDHFRAVHPDVDIVIQDFDIPQLYDVMVTQGGCRSGDWDLFLVIADWLPQLMQDRALLPLDSYLEVDPPQDWPRGWSESMLLLQRDQQGAVYALPYHDGPEVFMYRSDLFEDPEEQRRFEARHAYPLRPPETWSQFKDMARFFTRPQDDLYGCVIAAEPDGHNSVYDFLIQLWSRGGKLLDGRRAAFNSPEGYEALQFITDLIEQGLTQPDPRTYESVKSGEYYAAGHGAMMWNWLGFAIVAELPPSTVAGRTRTGLIPQGDGPGGRHASLNTYWVMSIPAGSRHSDEAWQFMKSTASPEMDRVTAEEGGTGTRLSTWRDPEIQRRFPPYTVIEEAHRGTETLPPIPEYPEINEILNRVIDEVHTGRRSVKEALDDAAQQVDAVLGAERQPLSEIT